MGTHAAGPLRRKQNFQSVKTRPIRALWAAILWLLLVATALAHPLGQLNANSIAEYRLKPHSLVVAYHITFNSGAALTRLPQLDKNGDGVIDAKEEAEYLQINSDHFRDNLNLFFDGRQIGLTINSSHLTKGVDPNGLPELGLDVELMSPLNIADTKEHVLKIDDKGFEGVGGWREIKATASEGIGLTGAPEPPQNAVEALQVSGEIKFHLGVATWTPKTQSVEVPKEKGRDQALLNMIGDSNGGLKAVALTLLLAYVLGALHALQPGHGKTVVGAYLIGSRGTVGHAILLGLIVTFTHTFSVILLGVVTLFAFQTVVPERLIPWMGFVSGLLVSGMGLMLLFYRDRLFGHTHSHGHGHSHGHAHAHEHAPNRLSPTAGPSLGKRPFAGTVSIESARVKERQSAYSDDDNDIRPAIAPLDVEDLGGHSHSHMIPEKLTLMGLISLGVSGGMVPCPDALVVLLGAISLKKLGLGLLVLLAFSTGLASVLVAIGVLMVKASHLFAKRYPSTTTIRRITELSYLFIVMMGLFLAFEALWSGGILHR